METPSEMIERVRRMAESYCYPLEDRAALRYVLAEAESARQLAEALEPMCALVRADYFIEDCPENESPALELFSAEAALAAWKARVGE